MYAKLNQNGEIETYPYSLAQLRADNPRTAFPANLSAEELAGFDVVPVADTEPPEYDPATHQPVEGTPELVEDQWVRTWTLEALPPPPIPSVVTRKQARMALVLSGVPLAAVQSAIDAIVDGTERALAQIAWDDAVEFRRDDPFLVAMAAALSLTESQLDDLYTLAATL